MLIYLTPYFIMQSKFFKKCNAIAVNACVSKMWQVDFTYEFATSICGFKVINLGLITNVITSKTAKQSRKRICKQKVSTRLKYG
jgi:hypothetical protein